MVVSAAETRGCCSARESRRSLTLWSWRASRRIAFVGTGYGFRETLRRDSIRVRKLSARALRRGNTADPTFVHSDLNRLLLEPGMMVMVMMVVVMMMTYDHHDLSLRRERSDEAEHESEREQDLFHDWNTLRTSP
jgi:hypothetical protein